MLAFTFSILLSLIEAASAYECYSRMTCSTWGGECPDFDYFFSKDQYIYYDGFYKCENPSQLRAAYYIERFDHEKYQHLYFDSEYKMIGYYFSYDGSVYDCRGLTNCINPTPLEFSFDTADTGITPDTATADPTRCGCAAAPGAMGLALVGMAMVAYRRRGMGTHG